MYVFSAGFPFCTWSTQNGCCFLVLKCFLSEVCIKTSFDVILDVRFSIGFPFYTWSTQNDCCFLVLKCFLSKVSIKTRYSIVTAPILHSWVSVKCLSFKRTLVKNNQTARSFYNMTISTLHRWIIVSFPYLHFLVKLSINTFMTLHHYTTFSC